MHTFDFGPQLRELFDTTDITQEQLAQIAGVSEAMVSRWKSGAYGPGVVELKRMRDSQHLPATFRHQCKHVTAEGARLERSELADLDRNRDGTVTDTDINRLDAEKQEVAAKLRGCLARAMDDGRISPDECAEQSRLIFEERAIADRELRAIELVAAAGTSRTPMRMAR